LRKIQVSIQYSIIRSHILLQFSFVKIGEEKSQLKVRKGNRAYTEEGESGVEQNERNERGQEGTEWIEASPNIFSQVDAHDRLTGLSIVRPLRVRA